MERLSISLELRTGLSIIGSLARSEAQLEAHGLNRQKQIGENDGGVDVQNLHRLQRDLRGQIRAFAQFQDSVLGADVPVLLHIAAGLTHEPDWPDVGGPTAASFKKAAVHGSHTHVKFHLLLLVTFSK